MTAKKNLILTLASIGTFVEALDIAIINLTIPAIQEQFHITESTVQWLQTLYVLFFGGFLIIGGKLSDQFGRKKIFLWGGLIFMLSSLGAGLSTHFEVLAFFRAIQGLGAAFIMPSALSIVTHTFRETQERSRALGIFSSFAAIGSGSGLSVGGIISTYLSWHWVFLINVPILLVTLILAYRHLPKDSTAKDKPKTDTVSGILLVIGLLSLTYGTHELIHIQAQPWLVMGTLSVAVIILGWVLYRLKNVAQPLIDLRLFQHRSLVISNLAFLALGAFFIGFLFLVSLMLQKDMGHSAAGAGLLLVPFSIMSALVAKFILPLLARRWSSTRLGLLGWSSMCMGAGCLFLSIYLQHPLGLILLGAACISGIGMTLCFTSLSLLAISDVSASNYGVASSLTNTCYFIGAGIGLSFMTLLAQFFPSQWAVDALSLGVLLLYAFLGLGAVLFLQLKGAKK